MSTTLLMRGPYREATVSQLRDALTTDWTVRSGEPGMGRLDDLLEQSGDVLLRCRSRRPASG